MRSETIWRNGERASFPLFPMNEFRFDRRSDAMQARQMKRYVERKLRLSRLRKIFERSSMLLIDRYKVVYNR